MSTEKPLPPAPPHRARHREAWVGLFVLAGIAISLVVLATLTDAALFRGRYVVATNVPNAGGIRKGDPVQMRGVNVGRILGFRIAGTGVDIRLEIEGEYPIPSDSRVELKASGLLGGMVADVIPGTSSRPLGWGDRLPGASGIGLFDKVDTLAGEADKVARQLRTLLSEQTITNLQEGTGEANRALQQLSGVLKEQRGELRSLTASLRRSAEGVERVTAGPDLERTVEKIETLADRLDALAQGLDRSTQSLESILGRLDRGEGSLGKLSRDEALYDNVTEAAAGINKAAIEVQKLVEDVRREPKKYLKFSVF